MSDDFRVDYALSPLTNIVNNALVMATASKLEGRQVIVSVFAGPQSHRFVELYDKHRPEHSLLLQDRGDGFFQAVAIGALALRDGSTRREYRRLDGHVISTDGADLFGRPVPGDLRLQCHLHVLPEGLRSLVTSGHLEEAHLVQQPNPQPALRNLMSF